MLNSPLCTSATVMHTTAPLNGSDINFSAPDSFTPECKKPLSEATPSYIYPSYLCSFRQSKKGPSIRVVLSTPCITSQSMIIISSLTARGSEPLCCISHRSSNTPNAGLLPFERLRYRFRVPLSYCSLQSYVPA